LADFATYPGVAALVLWEDEQENPGRNRSPIGAWTTAGALKLAELLPDDLAEVRGEITLHFANLS
jgi:hypothetical protein